VPSRNASDTAASAPAPLPNSTVQRPCIVDTRLPTARAAGTMSSIVATSPSVVTR
jgi:hypothetical protein